MITRRHPTHRRKIFPNLLAPPFQLLQLRLQKRQVVRVRLERGLERGLGARQRVGQGPLRLGQFPQPLANILVVRDALPNLLRQNLLTPPHRLQAIANSVRLHALPPELRAEAEAVPLSRRVDPVRVPQVPFLQRRRRRGGRSG